MQPKKLSQEAEYRFYGSNIDVGNPERVGMPIQILFSLKLVLLFNTDLRMVSAMKRTVQYNSESDAL